MSPAEARRRFGAARVARLATVSAEGHPHLVPIVFALRENTIYSVVDAKPKRTMQLRRLENVRSNPHVSAIVDHYEDADWSALWWVRADGQGRLLSPTQPEALHALAQLAERYPQQLPTGDLLVIDVASWSHWSAAEAIA